LKRGKFSSTYQKVYYPIKRKIKQRELGAC
jgi:hypothetical protein